MQSARCLRAKCMKIIQPERCTRGDQANLFLKFLWLFFWSWHHLKNAPDSKNLCKSTECAEPATLRCTCGDAIPRKMIQKDATEVIDLRCRSLEAEPSWHLAAFSLWRQSIREHLEKFHQSIQFEIWGCTNDQRFEAYLWWRQTKKDGSVRRMHQRWSIWDVAA